MKPMFRLAALAMAAGVAVATVDARTQVEVKPIQVPTGPVKVQPVPGMTNPQVALITSKDVQKDLKLSEEQIKKVNELGEKQTAAMKNIGAGKDALQKIREIMESTKKELEAVLTKEQTVRLQQINLQAKGPIAFFDNDVIRDLNISQEQRLTLIKTITQAMTKQSKAMFEMKDLKIDEMQKKMTEMNREAVKEIVQQLTPERLCLKIPPTDPDSFHRIPFSFEVVEKK
jgi:hypothetical protein